MVRDVRPVGGDKSAFGLDGLVVAVTGAAGGIGGAVARAFAEQGASVAAFGRRIDDRLTRLVEALPGRGTHLALAADASSPDELSSAIGSARSKLGRLDVLVNAAGTHLREDAMAITEEEWDRVSAVNLKGTFFACQAAARIMRDGGGGRIINITSLTSVIGLTRSAAYTATRGGGVAQLTRALAVEWAPLGINVNAIAPGRIRTPLTEELFADAATRNSFLRIIPQGRGGTPDDVAGPALFLASPLSAYMTGQIIVVDGGWLAGGGLPCQ